MDQSPNTDQIIVENIAKRDKVVLINAANKLVKEECRKICKRGSGSILQKKEHHDFLRFSWENYYYELQSSCPLLLSTVSAIVCDIPPAIPSKHFMHIMITAAIGLHSRSQELSVVQYLIGMVLTHGGCAQKDIQCLSTLGLAVHPQTLHRKLATWESTLSENLLQIKEAWANGGETKYQLVGDNWDKNILPSYRTTERGTLSLHLFNVYAVVDRVIPTSKSPDVGVHTQVDLSLLTFIPSIDEQDILLKELTFQFASSVIEHHPKLKQNFQHIYPIHLKHKYSQFAGLKTTQYPLGLFDCNENKTQEIIQLMKTLSDLFVPIKDGDMVEPVFFGGDRLTDERVNGAQCAMKNENSPTERLEGFISKIEDFHRLMNFLEAIHKLTYDTGSGRDPCTMYYYRNLLNARNVKGHVKNSYRPYKQLFYTVLDALCIVHFLHHFHLADLDSEIPFPDNFMQMTNEDKIDWLNETCRTILKGEFFDNEDDIFSSLRKILEDPNHEENYWVSCRQNQRFHCHFCDRNYACVGSLKAHEERVHNYIARVQKKTQSKEQRKLKDYISMLFKLILIHRNLDEAVDMGDGERSTRSAKYELPIYHKTGKTKYTIGSIHLTALVSGLLSPQQTERLIANRFVNVQGGANNNIALDEYLEMLNRDSKIACRGHQTKESILKHSKEYPLLVEMTKHVEKISSASVRKGFHHLPSYTADVQLVLKDLLERNAVQSEEEIKCKNLIAERNPFDKCASKLSTMIQRHNPTSPYCRLKDPHV